LGLAKTQVEVGGVDHLAVDVELPLLGGRVTDPHGTGALVALQLGELSFVYVGASVDSVHGLEPTGLALVDPLQPGDEVGRLVVVAKELESVEQEGRVPQPTAAGVPVPLA